MSAIRRFFNSDDENSVFRFQIDTNNIVTGATDGSENPLIFTIPLRTSSGINNNAKFIIRVSDGRPDISVVGNSETESKSTLTFSTAGIYTVELIGKFFGFSFYFIPVSSKKIIKISRWGLPGFANFDMRAFYQCTNLVIDAHDTLVLPTNPSWFFQWIKGFETSLTLIDTSKVVDAMRMTSGVANPLPDGYNAFWKSLTSFEEVYNGNTFSTAFNKIEVISDSIETLYQPWNSITFLNTGTIRLVCQTPNLKRMFRVFRNGQVKTRCHGGEIDVRNVTNTTEWLTGTFTQAQVDATLLGWAQLPFMQSGVTWNWNGSKYSNNPAVIAAYNKITNDWGVIFTNLTMA